MIQSNDRLHDFDFHNQMLLLYPQTPLVLIIRIKYVLSVIDFSRHQLCTLVAWVHLGAAHRLRYLCGKRRYTLTWVQNVMNGNRKMQYQFMPLFYFNCSNIKTVFGWKTDHKHRPSSANDTHNSELYYISGRGSRTKILYNIKLIIIWNQTYPY